MLPMKCAHSRLKELLETWAETLLTTVLRQMSLPQLQKQPERKHRIFSSAKSGSCQHWFQGTTTNGPAFKV